MRVAIIGAGLQCRRRAPVLVDSKDDQLVAISSLEFAHAEATARQFGCKADRAWEETVHRSDIDAVVVCTPPYAHAEISIAAMRAGKHVLCEKPLSRTLEEAEAMAEVSRETGRVLKCGFNHRHHPAIWEAHRRLEAGELGRPVFARCRYGICGRPGYENEWRADPAQAAGGQFIEQGTHGIDLIRWFLGEIDEVSCMTATHFFKEQSLEDDGFAIFRTGAGATASLHTSLVQWQNLFSFEVFGDEGYARVEGLGAAYGTEQLFLGRRDFTAPFQDHVIQYRGGDISWRDEWREFAAAVREQREPVGGAGDGVVAMRVALACYEAERQRRVISIDRWGGGRG
jgi:predicted dehydrogenase